MVANLLKLASRRLRQEGISGFVMRLPDRVGMAFQLARIRWQKNIVHVGGLQFDTGEGLLDSATVVALKQGNYEISELALMKKYLPAELPVIELGGCIGVVSCFVNRHLDNPHAHLVVEANEAALDVLRRNRELNNSKFVVRHKLIGYGDDSSFFINENALSSSRHRSGRRVSVELVTLQALVQEMKFERASLICDIEGTEADLAREELEVLRNHFAWIFVEVHGSVIGADGVKNLFERFEEAGFDEVDADRGVHCLKNRAFYEC